MEFKKREKKRTVSLLLNLSTYHKLLLLCENKKIKRGYALEQIVEDYFEREPVGMGAARE